MECIRSIWYDPGPMRFADPLDDVFATGSHVRVLRALARLPEGFAASAREIARRAGIAHPTALRVLASLLEQGVVFVSRAPRADLYRLNPDHVVAEQLLPLFERETALRDELLAFLRDRIVRHAPFVSAAFLFGSVVEGGRTPHSDIDLAIVFPPGHVGDAEGAMEPIEDATRRRFGNRLSVLLGVGPVQGLTKRGRSGARLWRSILSSGIPVLPGPRRPHA